MSDLAADVRSLTEEIAKLALGVQQLSKRITRSERGIIGVVLALVLDLILTGAIVYGGLTVAALADCQQQWVTQVRQALIARSSTADLQTNAQITQLQNQLTLFATISSATSREERAAAGLSYQNSVAEQIKALQAGKAARANNPLPEAHC